MTLEELRDKSAILDGDKWRGARKGAKEKWTGKWHKLMLHWSFTKNAESREPEGSHLDGQGHGDQKPEAAARAFEPPKTELPNPGPEDNLPSDLDNYAPSMEPPGPQAPIEDQPRPAEPHEPQAPLEDRPRPAEPHEPQASVSDQGEPRRSPGAPSRPSPTTTTAGRGQWPQATAVRVWKRYDNNASRFRVSSSTGPMWSDVFRRQTLDLDKNELIADETFTGDERPRRLSQALPKGSRTSRPPCFIAHSQDIQTLELRLARTWSEAPMLRRTSGFSIVASNVDMMVREPGANLNQNPEWAARGLLIVLHPVVTSGSSQ